MCLQEPFRACTFSIFFLIDASRESTGESVHWHKPDSSEPSLFENAITVHYDIFQIKHWNINKRVLIRTYFLKKVVTRTPFRACTACPDTKIKILNQGPRMSNGLDTDHD